MSSNCSELFSKQSWLGYIQLCRLDKPVGILLVLWPTLWALLDAAQGLPAFWVLFVFMVGVVLMRSAGCVINDYADRRWDGAVERTQFRPLVIGLVSTRQALGLFIVLCLIAFFLVLTLNTLTILLSFAALLLAAIYPFTKRVTYLPQFVLGAAFSWAIPMAYAAVLNTVPAQAWILMVANLCWTVAYDTQYAMVDRDDDLKVGIKSTAILFAQYDKLAIALLQAVALLALLAFGDMQEYRWPYWVVLIAVSAHFFMQANWLKTRERSQCFRAFKANNQVGLLVTVGIAATLCLG